MSSLAAARRAYAEALRTPESIRLGDPRRSDTVVEAFAAVPREAFAGPPPWTLLEPGRSLAESVSADPADLYTDRLIALIASKGLNNGQPSFWARLFERLSVTPGETVVHVGAGAGYYTAILAEMAGSSGRVTGVEIESELAARARAALAAWPQAEVVQGSALETPFGPVDVIVASAGLSELPAIWLGWLNPGGRMLIPLTADGEWRLPNGERWSGGWGAMLLVTRGPEGFAAEFISSTAIYPCIGGRSPESNARLHLALQAGGTERVRSVRLAGSPDETCWLAGEGWWLSTAPPG